MQDYSNFGVKRDFFGKPPTEASRRKHEIVLKYFIAYNRVMTPKFPNVGYADLFAGPGRYASEDGATHSSIPLLVLRQVIGNEGFRNKVRLWFNDADPANHRELMKAIESEPGFDSLRYKPVVSNRVVDKHWAEKLERLKIPTLVFLDPCGYKGLSLRLVAAALAGFGNDCIFFFNYSRINMKLDLEIMNDSIDEFDEFFEPDRASELRKRIRGRSADEREKSILEAVTDAIKSAQAIPVVYRFRTDSGRRSHHLVYASKNARAAEMMKRITTAASSDISSGVGSAEHNPRLTGTTPSLFDGLFLVEERLLSQFAGQELSFGEILDRETLQQCTETNYRDALLALEHAGRVRVEPKAERRPFQAGREKRTLARSVRITFPKER